MPLAKPQRRGQADAQSRRIRTPAVHSALCRPHALTHAQLLHMPMQQVPKAAYPYPYSPCSYTHGLWGPCAHLLQMPMQQGNRPCHSSHITRLGRTYLLQMPMQQGHQPRLNLSRSSSCPGSSR